MQAFQLSEHFLNKYRGKQPNWGFGDLSYFTFKRTYALVMGNGEQEEYFDTVKRCVEGVYNIQMDHCHRFHLPWDGHMAQRSAQKMFQKIWEFKFTPPGRGFWKMGTETVKRKGSACLFNCGFVSTEDIKKNIESFSKPFTWAMDMLMLGVGIGFDTRGADSVILKQPEEEENTYLIEDSREGWVNAVRLLLTSYVQPSLGTIRFDSSLIRPAGSPISGFGGVASGPQPLMEGLESIRTILNGLVGQKITSVAIVDIMNFIGKIVVSGNVRRSAEIAIGDPRDSFFMEMKDPDKYSKELNDRRYCSNNSIYFSPDFPMGEIVSLIAKNGEPGIVVKDNIQQYGRLKDGRHLPGSSKFDFATGVNPCAEINLESFELCNICETYPANHETAEEYMETLKYAFLFCKSVTLLPTHSKETNSVMMRNRRIGISQTGIQQALQKFGHVKYFNDICDKGYEVLEHWDHIYSRWLGVPVSIKRTTVKPSGTVSLLSGSTPGVHWTHSPFYFRTIRVPANSPLVKSLMKANYRLEVSVTDISKIARMYNESKLANSEKSIDLSVLNYDDPDVVVYNWMKDFNDEERDYLTHVENTTLVAYFPIKERNFTKSKFDVSVWEQLLLVRELQTVWADNSVSVTITFDKEKDTQELATALNYYLPYIKTLSFLPLTDHRYLQAPYIEIDENTYEEYMEQYGPLDLSSVVEDNIVGDKYCSNDSCTI